jgi:hypothetical protein
VCSIVSTAFRPRPTTPVVLFCKVTEIGRCLSIRATRLY